MTASNYTYRLRRTIEFNQVYRYRRSQVSKRAVLYIKPVAVGDEGVAFVAGKKVGNAVCRNRAKRLMREVWRLHRDLLKPGFRCILIARSAMATSNYESAKADILMMMKRAKVLSR